MTERRRRDPGSNTRLCGCWGVVLAVVLSGLAGGAGASEFLLPGLDPLLHGTDDPRLLGADRLVLREALRDQGVDPAKGEGLPSLENRFRMLIQARINVDMEREAVEREVNGPYGIETTFRYPEWVLFYPSPRELPGGFLYYPPRDVGSEMVDLFIDDPRASQARRLSVANARVRLGGLNVAGSGVQRSDEGLINLTIRVKFPRTLERIIGKGEKTNIRISGREHISLGGESKVSNKYQTNERRQSQSLFPSLDMEQQLQINLSGQIGEKIHIEVDHNSEAFGPEATKIRLYYEGSEDDIIQTIESGDVGLTLPGSQLLGYSSNKSGLFGLKVTGQAGPADFTVVASKQQSESSSQSFNSSGGTVSVQQIAANQYLNNRFFRLDLPPAWAAAGLFEVPDDPGRDFFSESIDMGTIQVFKFIGASGLGVGDVQNVVAIPDSTGRWDQGGAGDVTEDQDGDGDVDYIDWALVHRPNGFEEGEWWRPVEFSLMTDTDENVLALDLKHEYAWDDLLAVVYTVVGPDGETLYRVGDVPGENEVDRIELEEGGTRFLKMKLLKPTDPGRSPHAWQYVLRNIYPLRGSNIDLSTFKFSLGINSLDQSSNFVPGQTTPDGLGIEWFQVFGLDRSSEQGGEEPDGLPDFHDPTIFDLANGLLKFPTNMPRPFDSEPGVYEGFAPEGFDYGDSGLEGYRMSTLYDPVSSASQLTQNNDKMRFEVEHASTSSSINLGVSNIEEGSETVTLDGRTLVRGEQYDIDYTFGEITLKGDAAGSLQADSNIGVTYQYAPFVGGGNSSLLGMNLGYQLGRESRLSTTWLWESNQVVGHKAKLGEEPSRTLVGNLNGQFHFKPRILTSFANLLSRRDSDRESSVQLSGEMAISLPNPNTFDDAHVEDFEGVDSSDVMPVNRLSWSHSSAPVHDEGLQLDPEHPDFLDLQYLESTAYEEARRLETRWFLPRSLTERRHLNPDLKEQEGRESQQVLQVHMRTEDGAQWSAEDWGGIMRGLSRSGIDLTKTQFLEFWVNDYRHDVLGAPPTGTLHFDFGAIDEDFYWRDRQGDPEYGILNREDGILDGEHDGVFTQSQDKNEDIGLGGDPDGFDRYSAEYGSDDDPYPYINGTAGNYREDTEDLNGDTRLNKLNGYYTLSVNLADSALVDVLRDYPASEVSDNIDESRAWRKYRVRLGDLLPVEPPIDGRSPSLATVTHMRIWFEDRDPVPGTTRRDLQLSEIKFLGSRWEREGVRRLATAEDPQEQLLEHTERGPDESFFLGEVNNKENPDYEPPFELYVLNNIPEKESSLVLDYRNLEHQHLARVSRIVSPRGEDYTKYNKLSYYVYNPSPEQADTDVFFRVGADSLNFYEVNYRFDENDGVRYGWHEIRLDLAELSNVKLSPRDPVTGWIHEEVPDDATGQPYRVRVVGTPDLRRVKRFYFGVRNTDRTQPVSGYFWFNDIKLREVKRDVGLAQRLAMRVNMANQINLDFDWSKRDADFHGLNAQAGQGFTNEDWSLSGNLHVDDFVPLLGFRMPVSLGKQRATQRPKYVTNSDIEIIDEALRDQESSIDERENFSVRLSRPQPSGFAPLRYLLDPWQFSLSGSRGSNDTPLQHSRNRNLQGSISYDLRLGDGHSLGDYPLLGSVPLVKAFNPLPTNLSFSGTFTSTRRQSSSLQTSTGQFIEQPLSESRRGTLNAKVDAKPLPIVGMGLTIRSDRDLFREQRRLGINIGTETVYNQSLRLDFRMPTRLGLPDNWLGRPLTAIYGEIQDLNPSIKFTGSYNDDHSPSVRQTGDPTGVSNVNNGGDWNLTFNVPVGGKFSQLFPKKVEVRDDERDRMLREIRNRSRRGQIEDEELKGLVEQLNSSQLTDREEERLENQIVDLARQLEEERRQSVTGTAGADSSAALFAGDGGGFRIPNPLTPLMDVVRGIQPVSLSWTRKDEGSYSRFQGETDFWYQAGLTHDLEAPDSLYVGRSDSERTSRKASTRLKVSRWLSVDVKYDETETSLKQAAGLRTTGFTRSWPDLSFSVGGLERLGLLGGGGQDAAIRSADLNLTYKKSRAVVGQTATQSNPQESVQISPRWTMNFRSGLSTTLNVVMSQDDSENNGTLTQSGRFSINAQVKHQFRAEGLLSRLGLYRPGNSPKVNMSVDLKYSDDSRDRWLPGQSRAEEPHTTTGTMRFSISPSFTYNITRNLTGSMRMNYARDRTKETDTIIQRFGLGVEATFTF